MFIVVVENEEILSRLLGKQPLLHLLIDLHGTMSDNVVWRHIQFCSHMRMEILGRFHLVAGNLRSNAAAFAHTQHFFRQGNTDIAANTDARKARSQQQAEQRDCRRLAIRSRNSTDRRLRQLISHLYLSHHTDVTPIGCLDDGNADGNCRRHDDKIHAIQQRFLLRPKNQRNIRRPQLRKTDPRAL